MHDTVCASMIQTLAWTRGRGRIRGGGAASVFIGAGISRGKMREIDEFFSGRGRAG